MMTETEEATLRARALNDQEFLEELIQDPKAAAGKLNISLSPEECQLILDQADALREHAKTLQAASDKAGEGKIFGVFWTKFGKKDGPKR